MKQWIFNSAMIGGLIFAGACGNDQQEAKKTESKKLSNEEALDAEIQAIDDDAAKHDIIANSLSYSKENGEAVEVLAHLNPKNEILKLEEKFSEGQGKNNGIITYYFKSGVLFATREYFEDYIDPTAVKFVDRISYYDAKGEKAISTKEKRVNFEEELAGVGYVSAPLRNCSVDRAMRVLDQKGEFETTFQGFALSEESFNHLIVGQPGENGYTTALRIEQEDPFILKAMQDPKGFLNKKCRITFQVANTSGFMYQQYLGGEWI